MSWDFWNNPLVVSAFRVKYRRGGLFTIVSSYLLVLALGGAVLQYYDAQWGGSWPRDFYIAVMVLQFFVSCGVAATATSTSMRMEMANKTWDFQRLTGLTPRQLLVGKLLGEPALAYLLALATVPLTFICLISGGVSVETYALLYLTLAATTVLVGVFGLSSLWASRSKAARSGTGNAVARFLVLGIVSLQLMGFIVSSITTGMTGRGPSQMKVPFYGLEVPVLVGVPVVEIALAVILFECLVRHVTSPSIPALGKRMSYVILVGVDLLAAGLVNAQMRAREGWMTLGQWVLVFCLVHLLASLMLAVGVTPDQAILRSWIWRFRGLRSWWRDYWLGERTPNGLVLLTYVAVGAVSLYGLLLWPVVAEHGWKPVQESQRLILAAASVTGIVILALGTYLQWALFLAGRVGSGFLILFLMVLIVAPPLVGGFYDLEPIALLSPVYLIILWFTGKPWSAGEVMPSVLIYSLVFLASWLLLRESMRRFTQRVHHRLQQMGALGARN